jgi:hypothetical protein
MSHQDLDFNQVAEAVQIGAGEHRERQRTRVAEIIIPRPGYANLAVTELTQLRAALYDRWAVREGIPDVSIEK